MIDQAPISPPLMYDEAELYTYTCTHDNKYDWRMPTQDEWNRTVGMTGWYELLNMQMYRPNLTVQVIPVRTV
jgi:hypothetical protein